MSALAVGDDEPVLGSVLPRIFTPPLITGDRGACVCGSCALTPATSFGFDVIDFARDVLGTPLDEWQQFLVVHAGELLPDGRPRFRTMLAIVARQQGKALDTQTPMLTTAGWSTMGELQAGDEVFHPDGHPTRIVAAHDVQRDRPCYRVTTTDGRTLVVDGEHLWTVQDVRVLKTAESWAAGRCVVGPDGAHRPRERAWETLTTEQLVERGVMRFERPRKSGGVQREFAYRLPVQHAITSKPADLPVDPYLLGAWLGDGTSTAPALTVGGEDLDEMRTLVEATGARIVSVKRCRTAWRLQFSADPQRRKVCTFRTALIELGTWNAKRIPDAYLTGSAEQRLALLQGLMDTDGSIFATASGCSRAEFCTTNPHLAEGVLYLARSLGWRATSKESAAKLNGVEVSRRWRVCWTPQQGDPIPFRLRRKAARVQAPNARGGERHAVSIASIEPVESRPVRCITVDRADGLFLAGRDLVATHNSFLLRTLILYWMFVERQPLTLATSTDRGYAKAAWMSAVDVATTNEWLKEDLPARPTVLQIGEEELRTVHGAKYKFSAVNRRTGRSLSIDRLVLDEIREHANFDAWGASTNAMNARPAAQIWAVSNQGDDASVVLDWLRNAALAYLDTGVGDRRLGIFEWSAPAGSRLDDPHALAYANPSMGRRTDTESLVGAAKAALSGDSEARTSFQTEVLCMRVDKLDPAIDPAAWRAAGTDTPVDLAQHRGRVALCLDVSLDGLHASLVAAVVLGEGVQARTHVEVVEHWEGRDCTHRLRAELPALAERVGPRMIGWIPNGPAAAITAGLQERKRDAVRWPPRRCKLEEIRGDVTAVCMGLAEQVLAGQVVHPNDPMLNAHINAAVKAPRGDAWVFGRKDSGGPIDGTYAVAGAVHLARTMPALPPPLTAV